MKTRSAIYLVCLSALMLVTACSKEQNLRRYGAERPDGIRRLELYYVPLSILSSAALTGDAVQRNPAYVVTIYSPDRDNEIDAMLEAVKGSTMPCRRTGFEIRLRILALNDSGEVLRKIDVSQAEQCAVIDGKSLECGDALAKWCERFTTNLR